MAERTNQPWPSQHWILRGFTGILLVTTVLLIFVVASAACLFMLDTENSVTRVFEGGFFGTKSRARPPSGETRAAHNAGAAWGSFHVSDAHSASHPQGTTRSEWKSI